MATAYLVLGPRYSPIVAQRDMLQDRGGAWFIHDQSPDNAPRYRAGDGILFWTEQEACEHAIELFRKGIRYAESRIILLEARIGR